MCLYYFWSFCWVFYYRRFIFGLLRFRYSFRIPQVVETEGLIRLGVLINRSEAIASNFRSLIRARYKSTILLLYLHLLIVLCQRLLNVILFHSLRLEFLLPIIPLLPPVVVSFVFVRVGSPILRPKVYELAVSIV